MRICGFVPEKHSDLSSYKISAAKLNQSQSIETIRGVHVCSDDMCTHSDLSSYENTESFGGMNHAQQCQIKSVL